MSKVSFVIAAAMTLFAAAVVQADVLSITDPAYEVPNSPEGVVRPKQGMSMAKVLKQFGEPEQKVAPVGEPPISRWIYKDFVVYFEHDLVIHSVVKHNTQ